MPPCKKSLNIFKEFKKEEVALTVYCCQSEGHDGDHEWHLWTDDENKLQPSGKGVIKVIH